jgi:hypothetical protein
MTLTPTPIVHPALAALTGNAGHPAADVLAFVNSGVWIDANHLLHGPRFTVDLIPESTVQSIIHPVTGIVHTNGSSGTVTPAQSVAYWRRPDVVGEAHLAIGYDNAIQAVPLNRRADCNYKANLWYLPSGVAVGAISLECQDDGAATVATTPLTLRQLDLAASVLTAVCVCYGAWCTQPAAWDDSGIGHHILFPEWWKTPRSCPGAARIRQMDALRKLVADRLVAFGANVAGWHCGMGRPT